MSRIGLSSFIEFEVTGDGVTRPVHGVRSILSKGTEEGLVVELGDVPIPGRLKAPANGLTAFFGFRHTVTYLNRLSAAAERAKNLFIRIDLGVNVDNVKLGAIKKGELKGVDYLGVDKLAEEIRPDFIDRVKAAMKGERNQPDIESIRDVGRAPHAIGKVAEQGPYRHLAVISYEVPQEKEAAVPLATVFDLDRIEADVREGQPIDRFMARRLVGYLMEEGAPAIPPEEIHLEKVPTALYERLAKDPAYKNYQMRFYRKPVRGESRIVHDWDGRWKGRTCVPLRSLPPTPITVVLPKL